MDEYIAVVNLIMSNSAPPKLKKFLTIDEQIDLLRSRDVLFRSEEVARHHLKTLGYYRISNYLYHFRKYPDNRRSSVQIDPLFKDHYRNGTFFEDAIDLCMFDQKLRVLVLEGALEINRSFGVYLGYRFSETKSGRNIDSIGSNGPYNKELDRKEVEGVIASTHGRAVGNNLDDPSIAHNIERYGYLYTWVLVNYLEFGQLISLYGVANNRVRAAIARDAGFSSLRGESEESLCVDFMACSNVVRHLRNVCAHNGRLFDQTFSVSNSEIDGKPIEKMKRDDKGSGETTRKATLLEFSIRQDSFLCDRLRGVSLDGRNFVGLDGDGLSQVSAFGALSILSLMLERTGWERYKEWRREIVALLTETKFSHTNILYRVGLEVPHHHGSVERQLAHRLWDRY